MIREHKIAIVLAVVLILLMWAPWITDGYAIDKITQVLGGPDTQICGYNGNCTTVKDAPKAVHWEPFGRWVECPISDPRTGWSREYFVDCFGQSGFARMSTP
jgi:hypothetical protein